VLLLWTRWRRTGRTVVAATVAVLLFLSVLPVGRWMLIPLENRFPTVERLPEKIDGIIVLGGAVSQTLTQAHHQPALNSAAERMTEFVALARLHPEARLVFTGGSAMVFNSELKEAPVARAFFASLGMDVSRIVFEDSSRNTYENALYTREVMKPQPGETWVLITSAFHMPRAYGSFVRVGWKVLPYPVDYMTTGSYRLRLGFSPSAGLTNLEFAIHEWLGMIAYRVLGYTDALFPVAP
jgi:uncharacterized SAM-binding protein YcdF (DUF218 family)